MSDFGWVDYSVVGATLLFSLLIGVYYAIGSKNKTNEDLLVGGRRSGSHFFVQFDPHTLWPLLIVLLISHSMGVWPIACSMLVTYLSAITVLGKLNSKIEGSVRSNAN